MRSNDEERFTTRQSTRNCTLREHVERHDVVYTLRPRVSTMVKDDAIRHEPGKQRDQEVTRITVAVAARKRRKSAGKESLGARAIEKVSH